MRVVDGSKTTEAEIARLLSTDDPVVVDHGTWGVVWVLNGDTIFEPGDLVEMFPGHMDSRMRLAGAPSAVAFHFPDGEMDKVANTIRCHL